MNRVSLDSIGVAGFGHDFGALQGKKTEIIEVFDAFANLGTDYFFIIIFLLGSKLPFLNRIPTARSNLFTRLGASLRDVSGELLSKSRAEKESGGLTAEMSQSIIGTLRKFSFAETVMS